MSATCSICSKQFKNDRALRSHINWHDPEYARNSKAGALKTNIKANKAASEKARLIREQKQANYKLSPKLCKNCNKVISFEKQINNFCSRSCSGRHSNKHRDDKWKAKQRQSFVKTMVKKNDKKIYIVTAKSKKIKKVKQIYKLKCAACNIEFQHYRKRKTCSKQCCTIYTISKIKENIKNGYNPQKHRGRHKKSYLEQSFEDWLIKNNITNFETEVPFRNNEQNKTYFVDFLFKDKNLIIELDGTQHKKTKEYDKIRDEYINKTYGMYVIRISHKEYLTKTRINEIYSLLN